MKLLVKDSDKQHLLEYSYDMKIKIIGRLEYSRDGCFSCLL